MKTVQEDDQKMIIGQPKSTNKDAEYKNKAIVRINS